MVRRFIAALLVTAGLVAASLAVAPATLALDIPCQSDNAGQCDLVKGENLAKTDNVAKIVGVALGILGGVAVIVIVIAGLMYAISGGDSGKVAAAKNAILYAVIGLIVAMLSGVIIGFVTGFFK